MDLRLYYQKVRQLEKELPGDAVVVSSLETPDGGKPGVFTEVPRRLAARLIVEGRVRLANAGESRSFREQEAAAKQAADQMAAASRLQVTLVPSADWRAPAAPNPSPKE